MIFDFESLKLTLVCTCQAEISQERGIVNKTFIVTISVIIVADNVICRSYQVSLEICINIVDIGKTAIMIADLFDIIVIHYLN